MVVYPDGVWYRLRYPGSPGKRLNQEHKIRQYGGGICIFDPTCALKLAFKPERTSTGYETAVSRIKALGWFLDKPIEPPIPTCERKRLLFNQCFPPATYKAIYNSAL